MLPGDGGDHGCVEVGIPGAEGDLSWARKAALNRRSRTVLRGALHVQANSGLRLFQNHAADEVGEAVDAAVLAPAAEFVDDFFGGAGVPITGGADLHGGRAREHEFNNIGGG